MKKLLVFILLVLFGSVLLLGGCQKNDISKADNSIESNEELVSSIIDIWQGRGTGWVIHMAADGNIPEVYRPEGLHMDLSTGGIEKGSANKEISVRYIYGDCFWSYDSKTNNLKVTVTLNNYYVNANGVELDCGMVDEFEGPLSSDKMTWTANWKTIITMFGKNKSEQVSTGRTLIFDKIQ